MATKKVIKVKTIKAKVIKVEKSEWENYDFDGYERGVIPEIMMNSIKDIYIKTDKNKYDDRLSCVDLPNDHKLAGQKGVLANADIKKYTCVAFYEGKVVNKDHLTNDYTMNLQHKRRLYTIDPLLEDSGNLSMYINDYRDDVINLNDPINNVNKKNCHFKNIIVNNKPYICVITTKDIQINQELLVDYSASYWLYKLNNNNQKK